MEVRRAVPGDEGRFRSLRIRALTEAPHAFGSTIEREESLTDDEWRARLANGATFFLVHDGDDVGLAGGFPHGGRIELVSMWVDPAHRGQGGADLLVEAVVRWCGGRRMRLHVVEGNDAAIRLYERHGFRPSGNRLVRESDSAVEIEYVRSAG